jgi:hypothetical protein
MWEYRVDPVPGNGNWVVPGTQDSVAKSDADANAQLRNLRATQGWELAAVGQANFYSKRPRVILLPSEAGSAKRPSALVRHTVNGSMEQTDPLP